MPIQFDNFDQQKIDRLKNHLTTMAEKGKAKFYEIFVDTLKAIPKTDEPSEFDAYEDYMTEDTEKIRICIYNSEASPRNDQYVFVLKAKNREEATEFGLNGMTQRTYTPKSISEWRERKDVKNSQNLEVLTLKKEIAELKRSLVASEEHNNTLQITIDESKANANKIGGIHWGEVASVAVEGFVRRNTHLIKKIPGGEALAGLIEEDNNRTIDITEQQGEVSFKKKESRESDQEHSDQEKEFIRLFHEMQKYFDETEMGQVMEILDVFSKDKSSFQTVLELVQEEK